MPDCSKLGGAGQRGSKNQIKGGKAAGKEKKQALKAGKRDNDSDSDYSYRSVVSAGGTRHVRRRRKHADGTYSDSESFHSSQDEEGEARRRRRRREREHGPDSAHSYYSVVSEGGTRHVRRRKRHEDGTYSASESYHSSDERELEDTDEDEDQIATSRLSKDSGNDSDSDSSSDYSYASETSEGGTRYETKRKRIRDEDGNIVGYGETKPVGKAVSDTESVKTRRGSVDESTKKSLEAMEASNNKAKSDMGVPDNAENITGEERWPGALEEVPSEFSDVTTDDDVDLSKMTEEEKKEYFAEKERKRQAREKRRREKYGSRYDEILKKKEQKRLEQLIKEQKEKDEQERLEKEQTEKERRRSSVRRSSLLSGKPRTPPKSMVTYEKGTPREYGPKKSADIRDHGLGHESWGKKDKEGKSRRGSDSSMNEGIMPKFKRETTMLQKLPPIPQGKLYKGDEGIENKGKGKKASMVDKESTMDTDEAQFEIVRDENQEENKESEPPPPQPEPVIEVGADGKLRLKKKKIDLSELDDETLRRLGIDPSLSAIEIAKKLKEMFGDDVKLTIGGEVVGTKGVDEFDSDMDDDKLAEQEDLDLTTLKGKRRVNVLFKRGGSALKRHLQRIIDECTLLERAKRNLDERDSSIDFLAHYRLVDPTKIDGYAKAFVIEDEDFDTVININALKIALEGIETLSKMTPRQREYVIKVLHIDEATEVTFRMFSVITALCERVTNMDSLSQHLLEICNMADIERKMELYKAMFYHNIPSYRNNNFITSESLKIEMMAGGLNWTQQDYVMEKMEPNKFGEISFLDYMCYIPLFLSLHDNICDNPLDMSNNKYQMPPRKRPPSVQRDMNPLGQPLKKSSTHRMKARSIEVLEGKFPKDEYSSEYMDVLNRYARLPNIFTNTNKKRSGSASSQSESGSSTYNLIY
ncbi:eukaryotic translation initiation factor 5B-like [Argopecten irradians]|uniref:eukaryotic translation initiation factor 5B-like n=1 Tax=Argopecten irradians TaxID=31199 RepID=UPI0037116596